MNIRDAVRVLAQSGEELYCKVCTVDKVDEETRTIDCTPIDEGAQILSANLQANQESKVGIVIFPKIGSYVIVGFLNSATAVVLLCDDVERIELSIDAGTSIKADKKNLEINGGGLGGLIKIEALTSKINELIKAFNNHTHTLQSGSVAVSGSASSQSNTSPISVPAITSKHKEVSRDDYENPNITHG